MATLKKVNRITVKLKTPNPLFEKWLCEWRDKAMDQNSKMQYTFTKALASLKKYPLPLQSGKDCIILKGFGHKLCQMLDKKLEEHKALTEDADTTVLYEHVEEVPKKKKKNNNEVVPKPKKSSLKTYKPAHRSGPYAILLTLLNKSQEPGYPGYMTKEEIIHNASSLCDKSFVKPDSGSFYTAWSSMSNLISKGFVEKKGVPAKFSLTVDGESVAIQLIDNNVNNDQENLEKNTNSSNSQKVTEEYKSTTACLVNSNDNVSNKCLMPKNLLSRQNISSNIDTIIFTPYSFDILLLVDTQETSGSSKNVEDDETIYELNKLGVMYEVRHLKVGDFTWICRHRENKNELVLPYVVERKRMDDLGHSIRDGRFHEQKFRLKQCGIQNLMYIVENFGKNSHTGLPISSLMQAATNTLIQDGFQVKFTQNHRHSMHYLTDLTSILKKMFENKTIISCSKENIVSQISLEDDIVPLMLFKEFNKGASKARNFKIKDIFIKQMLQLKSLSVEKAIAIVEKYPTPRLLKQEYDKLGSKGEKLLASIQYGPLKRNIGPVISRTIYQLYTNENLM